MTKTPGFRAIRRKFWLYVAGLVSLLAVVMAVEWSVASGALSVALSLVMFFGAYELGRWYTRALRQARERGDAW